MAINKEEWGSFIISLGIDIINSKDIEELEFKADIISIGMKMLLDEIEKEKEKGIGEVHTVTKPCVQCGYCCTKSNCAFGVWNSKKHKCEYLTDDNLCSKYDEIIKNPQQKWNPAFGYGCCMSLFNTVREDKIRRLNNGNVTL